jgi:hypothetical protein
MTYNTLTSYMTFGLQYSAPNLSIVPTGTRALTANNIYFTRFYAPEDISVTSLSTYCTTGVASATVGFGIYSSAALAGGTGTRLATTSANVSAATSSAKITGNLSATYQMVGGTVYYLALSSNSTATVSGYNTQGANAIYGSAAGQWLCTNINVGQSTPPASVTYAANANLGASVFFVIN